MQTYIQQHYHRLCLILILVVASFLRLWQLHQNPPSLYWDEVALGYNAYSILQTGSDEHGRTLPLDYFLSYRDYKPPVYIYAAVPFIQLLGLNEYAVRLPSALAGILSTYLTYLLVIKIFAQTHIKYRQTMALLSAFFFALSPWSIQLSRVAYEANVAHVLTLLAIYLFLVALNYHNIKRTLYLSLSAIFFVLTFYTFNANRVFTPLIIVFMTLLYAQELFMSPSKKLIRNSLLPIILASTLGLLMLLPLVPHLFSKEGQLRYREVNIFSNPAPLVLSQTRIERAGGAWWANFFNNRRVLYAQEWLSGYFAHFRGEFLFLKGDVNPRFSSQDVGQLYLISLPFILIGLYQSATKLGKGGYLLIGWLLLAPIPAAFAREVPHALRTMHILPTYDIFTAIGFLTLFRATSFAITTSLRKYFTLSQVIVLFVIAIFAYQVSYFLYNYHRYYALQYQDEWQYGYKPMVQSLVQIQDQYDQIIVTNAKGRAYANVLFYQAYPPAEFQRTKQYRYDDLGLFEVSSFGKYTFHGVDWLQEVRKVPSDQKVLVVGVPTEVKVGKFTKSVIKGLDQKVEFILNEIPQGIANATEQGVFNDLQAYNAYHQTNYRITKEDNWDESNYGIQN